MPPLIAFAGALGGLAVVRWAYKTAVRINRELEDARMHLDAAEIAGSVRRLLDVVKPSGILYLSWRITENADLRDSHGRLYAAFDAAIVLAELKATAVLLDEEVISASSGKKIHRVVVKKPGLEIRE